MKKDLAIFGLAFHGFAILLYLYGLIAPLIAVEGSAFVQAMRWLLGAFLISPSLLMYLIEAVIAIIGERNKFRAVKLVLVVVAIPMAFLIFASGFLRIIGGIYYVGLFVFEIVNVHRYHVFREL